MAADGKGDSATLLAPGMTRNEACPPHESGAVQPAAPASTRLGRPVQNHDEELDRPEVRRSTAHAEIPALPRAKVTVGDELRARPGPGWSTSPSTTVWSTQSAAQNHPWLDTPPHAKALAVTPAVSREVSVPVTAGPVDARHLRIEAEVAEVRKALEPYHGAATAAAPLLAACRQKDPHCMPWQIAEVLRSRHRETVNHRNPEMWVKLYVPKFFEGGYQPPGDARRKKTLMELCNWRRS